MLKFLFRTAVNHEWEGLMKEKLNSLEGNLIGKADDGSKLLLSLCQLDEYCFLEFTIIGNIRIKTFKGAEVLFIFSNDKSFTVDSDTQEIDTDYSSKQKIGLTNIDVDLSPELRTFLDQNELVEIHFKVEKSEIQFKIIENDTLKSTLEQH